MKKFSIVHKKVSKSKGFYHHEKEGVAVTEALRLSKANPTDSFRVLTVVCQAKDGVLHYANNVPWLDE